MCQRCTGFYVGAAYATVIIGLFRPGPSRRLLWAHGIAMLVMIPFGYHLLPQTALLRTVTGQLFAFGLVYYLLLNPADRWDWWHDCGSRRLAGYWICMAVGLPLLLLGLTHGSAKEAGVISWMGITGLMICFVLVVINFVVFALFGLERWHEARAS
jgi:hypothetical protein